MAGPKVRGSWWSCMWQLSYFRVLTQLSYPENTRIEFMCLQIERSISANSNLSGGMERCRQPYIEISHNWAQRMQSSHFLRMSVVDPISTGFRCLHFFEEQRLLLTNGSGGPNKESQHCGHPDQNACTNCPLGLGGGRDCMRLWDLKSSTIQS